MFVKDGRYLNKTRRSIYIADDGANSGVNNGVIVYLKNILVEE
jgi:hypothetical protein